MFSILPFLPALCPNMSEYTKSRDASMKIYAFVEVCAIIIDFMSIFLICGFVQGIVKRELSTYSKSSERHFLDNYIKEMHTNNPDENFNSKNVLNVYSKSSAMISLFCSRPTGDGGCWHVSGRFRNDINSNELLGVPMDRWTRIAEASSRWNRRACGSRQASHTERSCQVSDPSEEDSLWKFYHSLLFIYKAATTWNRRCARHCVFTQPFHRDFRTRPPKIQRWLDTMCPRYASPVSSINYS